jgi:hypothetical protein
LAVGEETHTQEQRDVGVTKVRHQLALLHVLRSNVFYSSISGINERIVDLLSSTYQTVYFNLQEFLNYHRYSLNDALKIISVKKSLHIIINFYLFD